ncbi:MAG: 50S ribosomal protein L19 [Chlamydiae bacterium]|nr:50S ribosomal protein L19 [Chlamydiota bacterium]
MKQNQIIQSLEGQQLKSDVPDFVVGDTLAVHTRIIEGEKERVQVFTGTVIARRDAGLSSTFSLYRVSYGSGMEKVFMTHSPRISKIDVLKKGDVRKSKLYYLRGVSGKRAKVKEKMKARIVSGASQVVTEGTSSSNE